MQEAVDGTVGTIDIIKIRRWGAQRSDAKRATASVSNAALAAQEEPAALFVTRPCSVFSWYTLSELITHDAF